MGGRQSQLVHGGCQGEVPQSCSRRGAVLAEVREVSAGRLGQLPDPRDEGLAVGIVTDDYVVLRPGHIKVGLAGHGFGLPRERSVAGRPAVKVNSGNDVPITSLSSQ